jgi:hypothetical protein
VRSEWRGKGQARMAWSLVQPQLGLAGLADLRARSVPYLGFLDYSTCIAPVALP